MYQSVHDPIITQAYVAGVTERVRLGLAIVNAPFYAPIVLAKQLSTLDEVSGGRLDVGLGLGWSREEFLAAGVSYERRGARVAEFVRCLRAIWTEELVSFDGSFYQLPPVRVEPKPVQRPHPPLLMGGSAAPALRRVGQIADGWISGSRQDLNKVSGDIAFMKATAREAGRDPELLRFIVRGVLQLDPPQSGDESGLGQSGTGSSTAERRPLHGSVEQIRADFRRLHEVGVTELFIDLNFDPQIGSPEADPDESMRSAEHILDVFAPG
jgi:probable F420-dependent oxidoreductase